MEKVKIANYEKTKDILEKLPLEILLRIFELLSYTDLKVVVLVSRRWRNIGETSSLWSSISVTVNPWNMSVMSEMLTRGRLRGLKNLKINATLSMEVSHAIVTHPKLENLTAVHTNQSDRGLR